jgi:hypothetical protein
MLISDICEPERYRPAENHKIAGYERISTVKSYFSDFCP